MFCILLRGVINCMMTVKTYLDKDSYGGVGIFANEFIPKGAITWVYSSGSDLFIPYGNLLCMPQNEKSTIEKFIYPAMIIENGESITGVMLDCDNGRHMNHNDNPNTGSFEPSKDEYMDVRSSIMYALRDILPGEEMTCDYLSFDPKELYLPRQHKTCVSFLYEQHLLKPA